MFISNMHPLFCLSIGLAIAKRLGEEGAQVVVSSRKLANVERAVGELQGMGISVLGIPCHVSKNQDRQTLIDKVLVTLVT